MPRTISWFLDTLNWVSRGYVWVFHDVGVGREVRGWLLVHQLVRFVHEVLELDAFLHELFGGELLVQVVRPALQRDLEVVRSGFEGAARRVAESPQVGLVVFGEAVRVVGSI